MCDKKYSAIFLKLEKKVCLFFFFKSIKVCYEFLHASKIIFLRQEINLVIFNFIPFKICFIAKKLFLCSKKKTFDLDRFRLSLFVNFMNVLLRTPSGNFCREISQRRFTSTKSSEFRWKSQSREQSDRDCDPSE